MLSADCIDISLLFVDNYKLGHRMGSEREQQFCLRWHNYQNCLLATLPQLLDGDDLTDVTLCAGGHNIRAHKVVLSACSQYFKQLFKEMVPMQHPVIVLPGTYYTDLCALVTFMYSGEVNIYEHQLAGLLSVAETLQIRGLAEFTWTGTVGNNEAVKKEGPRCKRPKTVTPVPAPGPGEEVSCVPPTLARTRPGQKPVQSSADQKVEDTDQSIAEDLSSRTPAAAVTATDPAETNHLTDQPGPPAVSLDLTHSPTDLTQGVAEPKRSCNTKMYATCFICGKQLSNQYNLRVHMETHQNAHYACSACNHVSRSRDALRKHVSYRHPTPAPTTTSAATARNP